MGTVRIWNTGKDDNGNDTKTIQYSDGSLGKIVHKNDNKGNDKKS